MSDEIAHAIADYYEDSNIISAIVKIREKAGQGSEDSTT